MSDLMNLLQIARKAAQKLSVQADKVDENCYERLTEAPAELMDLRQISHEIELLETGLTEFKDAQRELAKHLRERKKASREQTAEKARA